MPILRSKDRARGQWPVLGVWEGIIRPVLCWLYEYAVFAVQQGEKGEHIPIMCGL